MKRIFSILLSFLLLMVGGQAMATAYYYSDVAALSEASFVNGTHWANSCGGTRGTGAIAVAAADAFTICDGHTLTLGAGYTFGGATITVGSGAPGSGASGVLALGNFTLTMNTAAAVLVNTNIGSITVGTGGISFAGAGNLINGTGTNFAVGNVSFGGNATISSGGAVSLAGLTVAGTLAIPNSVTITENLSIGGAVTAAGNGLKLSDANHGITATVVAAINKLDTTSMTGGKTITFTPPTTAGQAVTVTAFTAPTTPGAAGVTLTCSGGTATGATVSPLIAQTTDYICTKNATTTVSAPIFSTKEKPTVFSEEVKH